MATSKVERAFDYKLVNVSGTMSYNTSSSNYQPLLTSTDFTNAVAAGYVPVAIHSFNTNGSQWFARRVAILSNGVEMNITFRTGSPSSSGSTNPTATVLFVKGLN